MKKPGAQEMLVHVSLHGNRTSQSGWNPDLSEPNGNVTGAVTYKQTMDQRQCYM